MWPPAKIITMSAAPMAKGGITPGDPGMTVHPIVSTRKKVPMNSATYFRIMDAGDGHRATGAAVAVSLAVQTTFYFQLGQRVGKSGADHGGFCVIEFLGQACLGAPA